MVRPFSTGWRSSFQYAWRTISRCAGSRYSVQMVSGSLMCASQSKTGKVFVTRSWPLPSCMGPPLEDTSSLSAASGLRSRRAATPIVADSEDRLRGGGACLEGRREDHAVLRENEASVEGNRDQPAKRRGGPRPEQEVRPAPAQQKNPVVLLREARGDQRSPPHSHGQRFRVSFRTPTEPHGLARDSLLGGIRGCRPGTRAARAGAPHHHLHGISRG